MIEERLSAQAVLGPGGRLEANFPGYEARAGQVAVAAAVERLLGEDGVLLCEAGTGIGKTFAYLAPALLSGRRVVVSTATRALQDQIAHRDLPFLQKLLGTSVDVELVKGLSNYLCRRRTAEVLLERGFEPLGEGSAIGAIDRFLQSTTSGDLNELTSLREDAPLRRRVASGADTRVGPGCAYFDECFVTRLRRRAETARILVVNHHLFFADLALRGPHPGRVLPDYDVAILDEAHQIEDIAASFFGSEVRTGRVLRLLAEVDAKISKARRNSERASTSSSDPARRALQSFFATVSSGSAPGRSALEADQWPRALRDLYFELDQRLDDLGAVLEGYEAEAPDAATREGLSQLGRRIQAVRQGLSEAVEGTPGHVAWFELGGGEASLGTTPVDVAEILRTRLFEATPAVGLLSATLSLATRAGPPSFAYVRSRLGLTDDPRVVELTIPSPFDFENQCLLYLPPDLPEPNQPAFLERASERAASLVEMSGGGAFVLTTSLSSMQFLGARLRELLPSLLVLVQGERPKEALLEVFRADQNAVLVATSSFWEGVDVPGAALRLVVIEKIPFAVPTDPIVRARGLSLEAQGKSAFSSLAVPDAALALKQGFGRLIRSQADRGVVAVLDPRLTQKPYGRRLLETLPKARRTPDLGEVERFVR